VYGENAVVCQEKNYCMLYEESYWTPHTFAVSDALDWLAQLVYHIPNMGEQMVRYYG
jgi:hypothetical protein